MNYRLIITMASNGELIYVLTCSDNPPLITINITNRYYLIDINIVKQYLAITASCEDAFVVQIEDARCMFFVNKSYSAYNIQPTITCEDSQSTKKYLSIIVNELRDREEGTYLWGINLRKHILRFILFNVLMN